LQFSKKRLCKSEIEQRSEKDEKELIPGQEAINGSESVVVLKKERSECDVCTFSSSLRFVFFSI